LRKVAFPAFHASGSDSPRAPPGAGNAGNPSAPTDTSTPLVGEPLASLSRPGRRRPCSSVPFLPYWNAESWTPRASKADTMSPLAEFLQLLFDEGRVVLRTCPVRGDERPRDARELLETAFATHCLHVAGPPVEWDAATGLAAAHLVANACWFLVSHREPP